MAIAKITARFDFPEKEGREFTELCRVLGLTKIAFLRKAIREAKEGMKE